jgi:hypothetical protein
MGCTVSMQTKYSAEELHNWLQNLNLEHNDTDTHIPTVLASKQHKHIL